MFWPVIGEFPDEAFNYGDDSRLMVTSCDLLVGCRYLGTSDRNKQAGYGKSCTCKKFGALRALFDLLISMGDYLICSNTCLNTNYFCSFVYVLYTRACTSRIIHMTSRMPKSLLPIMATMHTSGDGPTLSDHG